MADRTYKQWVDYHYKRLKKQMPNSPDSVIKTMAGDMAKKSFDLQNASKSSASMSEPVLTPRVGPGATSAPVPRPTATPTPSKPPVSLRPGALTPTATPTPVITGGTTGGVSYNDRIVGRIKATGAIATDGIKTYTTGKLEWVDFLPTLQTQDYVRIQKVLKDLGYSVKNKAQIDYILSTEFSNLFPVKTVDDLVSGLGKFKLPGGGEKAELPLRQIPALDRGTLVEFARSIVEDTLMMERLSPEMENKIVDDWMKKAKKGVVTMPTKKVRNPKTGKLENVVETKRAFDQEAEGLALADRLKQMFPDQYELAQGIGFAAEMKKILAGGM